MTNTHLIKPVLSDDYPVVDYGKGVYLYDTTGKRYLDGSSGAVTASIGHAVPEIVHVMKTQAERVSFVFRSQFTNEPAERLAEQLSNFAPGHLNWSFFVNSGSEATETAMKIAIQYWQEKGMPQKNKVLSRWMSYHGMTLGALSMSGYVTRRERFLPLLHDLPSLSAPYCYRCPFRQTYPGCRLLCAEELELAIKRLGPDHIAAFIAEPIIGAAGGAIVPPPEYYQHIKAICDKHDILFIADEVMTGIARTGKMFAIDHWGVVPDMMTLGKGMSGGYTPIAATLVSDRVMETILAGSKSIMGGHTYSANPLSTAVSLAVLQYVQKHQLAQKAEESGQYVMEKLQVLRRKYDMVGDIRGKGLLIGIEFVADRERKQPFPRSETTLTDRVVKQAAQNGLLLYPAAAGLTGTEGDAILVAPPLTIEKDEIDELIALLDQTLADVESWVNRYNVSDQRRA